ncbi:type I-B CRISPR-associated protein Cas5b [Pyrinomonas methylaliphatogenes]|uniref:CRISPR-associated protein (Cas_Cas5) n=1 Tax=Pyrinomonas methylaliphatogenes TaxID=454194 RepID=A0A0B6X1J2_9BACT|nr:type I-B CRISPR-associated protein Cas5b [Pyrinomonas methylaliphatogenes]CDM67166.1 CRISPR-associated protein (Cas_Cas5) [Pyrinomonas methylaliphatogenes]
MGKVPICLFTIRGQFAHWRKWFTTTSALTYSFPPRTAVIGMVGAILGVPREKVAEVFKASDTRTAVCPLRPIVKDRLAEKWRQTPPRLVKGRFDPAKMDESFQENLEVVRRPCYRIVFWHRNEALMENLKGRLQQKRWVYPPCLGIMGFLADVEWEDEDVAEEIEVDKADILSVLPLDEAMAKAIDLSESEVLLREERVPNEVFSDRTFRHLYLAYVSREAKPLKVRTNEQDKLKAFRLRRLCQQIVCFELCAN